MFENTFQFFFVETDRDKLLSMMSKLSWHTDEKSKIQLKNFDSLIGSWLDEKDENVSTLNCLTFNIIIYLKICSLVTLQVDKCLANRFCVDRQGLKIFKYISKYRVNQSYKNEIFITKKVISV